MSGEGRKGISAALAHPATLLMLGALITGTLGAAFSQLWEDRAARKAERLAAEDRLRSLQELAEAARIRADFLRGALERGLSPDRTAARRKAWDEAYVAWQTAWRARVSELDSFFGWSQESPLSGAVREGLAVSLALHDKCLTEAYEAALEVGGPAAPAGGASLAGAGSRADVAAAALDACFSDSHAANRRSFEDGKPRDPSEDADARLRDCSVVAWGAIRQFVARDLNCRSTAWTEAVCFDGSQECGADEPRRPQVMFAAREMIGWCWGDPARQTLRSPPSEPEAYDLLCWIEDGWWNRLTGLVRSAPR